MLELFARPEFLVAGGALISSPIIIHLINRMRFKRLRWAAMEFLLKAQKRSRRRLIIEQLILLLLRCLLVALAALLVLRFFGFGLGDLFQAQRENLHIVVLNDDLSMRDQHKGAEEARTAFALARKEVVQDGIFKAVSQSTTNDRVAVVLVSQAALDPKYTPKVYERLNDSAKLKQAVEEVELIQPTMIHADLLRGIDKAQKLIDDNKDKVVTVHVISDFRRHDWATVDARPLQEALLKLTKAGVKVRLTDTAPPPRPAGAQPGAPPYNENLAIIDMRPSTRVAGKGMPVMFTVTVANFSPRDTEVLVTAHDDATGTERFDVTFNERMPLKVPAGETATCSFELKFFPDLKGDNDREFAHISARLETPDRAPLANDGIAEDNVRHVAVEVRNKVPILLVDGRGADGRKDGGDSYFLRHALDSVSGPNQESKFDIVYADKLTGGEAMNILESADLGQYPTMLLLNVPTLTPKQVAGLEKFVREGGGVAFFVGPAVDPVQYNKLLYKDGQGVFPVPLEEKYFPAKGQKELPAEYTGRPHLLLRDDQFPSDKSEKIPIFGAIFKEARLRDFLKHLPVKRYWPTLPAHEWKSEPGRVREVANLPNEAPVAGGELANEAISLTDRLPTDKDEYKPYRSSLTKHRGRILAAATSTKTQGYQLAETINNLLTDRGDGKDEANLQEFWKVPDPKVDTLYKDFQNLRRRLMYSHPLVVVSQFGQGRVAAVLTTAGKEWNDWAGGITGSVLFAPIVWEMQNWLSSQSGESGLTVGSPLQLTVDRKRHGNKPLRVVRTYLRPVPGKGAVETQMERQFADAEQAAAGAGDGVKVEVKVDGAKVNGQDAKVEVKVDGVKVNGQDAKGGGKPGLPEGVDSFTFTKTLEPGLYITRLYFADNENDKVTPLQTWGHVFNVDARREGQLKRAANEDLESTFLRLAPADNPLLAPAAPTPEAFGTITNRPRDLSELPWFFVLFLGILVAEQALAVHLSFHLRGSEAELPSQAVNPHATTKAA
jgi:hypothetical protein